MRRTFLLLIALAVAGCTRARSVSIAWDVPAQLPAGYWILVDDRTVLKIAPPPVDPGCSCLKVTFKVPLGQHTIKVVAYSADGVLSSASPVVARID